MNVLKPKPKIEQLSENARLGLLYLCLIKGKLDLIYLSELIDPIAIDELSQYAEVQTDDIHLWVEQNKTPSIFSLYKWSEKVKASETLALFFERNTIEPEIHGDLYLLAGNKEKALGTYLKAIDKFKEKQSHQECKQVCEKILKLNMISLEQEFDILNILTNCHECCGELTHVVEVRKRLLELDILKNQKEKYAFVLRALAIDYSKLGIWNQYKKVREDAAIHFRKIGFWSESATDFIGLAVKSIDELNIKKGLEYAQEALNDAGVSKNIDLICRAKSIKAYLLSMDGNYDQAQEMAKEALGMALNNNLLETAAFVYRKMAGTYEYASNFTQAKIVYYEAVNFCETEKMDSQVQMCYSCLSWILLRLGEWKEALEACKSVLADSYVNNASKSTAHCVIAIIKASRGEMRSAEKHTKEGVFLAQKEHFLLMYHLLHLPMAKINELKGNFEGAKEWYLKIVDEWHLTKEKHDVLMSLMDAILFFESQGDKSYVIKALEIISIISQETGNPEALGALAFGLGLKASLQDEQVLAIKYFEDALKYLSSVNVPYQQVLVEYRLGKSLMASGESIKGTEVLKNILPAAKKLGVAPLISKITLEINKVANKKSSENNILSERQQDVLTLLNKGYSNKEIAAELSLSTRTVDMHMRHLFDKLGCNSRFEAIETARTLGLI